MDLASYLQARKIKPEAFGERVGLSRSQISRIARRKSRPALDKAQEISAATHGEVSVLDLLYGAERAA